MSDSPWQQKVDRYWRNSQAFAALLPDQVRRPEFVCDVCDQPTRGGPHFVVLSVDFADDPLVHIRCCGTVCARKAASWTYLNSLPAEAIL